MSHQEAEAEAEMKRTDWEAPTLEPLADKRIESNKPRTLAYRNSPRRATNQQPSLLDQSPGRKDSFLSPAIQDALDKSICSPEIAAGCHGDSLSPQLEPNLTASLKALDLDSDRKRKRVDSPAFTEYLFSQYTDEPCRKRRRTGTEPLRVGDAATQQPARNLSNDRADLIYHWIQKGRWPKHYFEPDEDTMMLLRMHRLMVSLPPLFLQRSNVLDAARRGIDPFFLTT